MPTPPPVEAPVVATIRARLEQHLQPTFVELHDESHLHAGHAGAASGGGHFRLAVVSDRFAGLSRLARHRLVYDCLDDLMRREIHALSMTTLTPEEHAGSWIA